MANVKVNAVGDQCPIPVVKATKALGEFKEAGTLEVQVDNEIAIQNLTRLADSKGLKSRSESWEIIFCHYYGSERPADHGRRGSFLPCR